MSSPHRTPPRWVRWTLGVVALVVPCVVWGLTTATAERSLGPHEATYEVTTDGLVVVDLGPLGTLQIDSPLPLGLGVDVTVQEIPSDLTAVGQAETLEGLSQDLEDYLRFFGGPQETISSVARALVVDALRRTGLALLVVAAGGASVYLLLGAARRRELTGVLAPRTFEITASVVLVGLVAASLSSSDPAAPRSDGRPASAVFAGTALEGARITGRLSGVVDTYGSLVLDFYRENEDFYAEANDNLVTAWDRRQSIERLNAVAAERHAEAPGASATDGATDGATDAGATTDPPGEASDGTTPDDAGTGDAPAGEDGTTSDEGAGDEATGDEATGDEGADAGQDVAAEDLVTLVVISDLHCNVGMADLVRTVVEGSGASVVLNAGDTTMNGTAVESFCVDSFASAIPAGVTTVVADGNHDSVETSATERSHGQVVLDGETVEVEGLRILGDRDPLETRLAAAAQPEREETPEEYAARLAETACAEQESGDGIDLLMIHTPRMGNDAIESGCVPNQISGHMHTRSGPERVGGGVRYVSGSTAGAVKDKLRIGPLNGTAEMTVLRFDREQRRFVDWQLVQIGTDASATVWPRLAWPRPVAADAGTTPSGEEGATTPDDATPTGDATPADDPASEEG